MLEVPLVDLHELIVVKLGVLACKYHGSIGSRHAHYQVLDNEQGKGVSFRTYTCGIFEIGFCLVYIMSAYVEDISELNEDVWYSPVNTS